MTLFDTLYEILYAHCTESCDHSIYGNVTIKADPCMNYSLWFTLHSTLYQNFRTRIKYSLSNLKVQLFCKQYRT